MYDLNTGTSLKGTRVRIFTLDSIRFVPAITDSSYSLPFKQEESYDSAYKLLSSVETDSSGYYSFDNLEPNVYRISAFYRIKKESRVLFRGNMQIQQAFH